MILSHTILEKWQGVDSGEEPTHYDLACDSEETFTFEDTDAFSLQEEGSTAVVPYEDGILFPRWVGADSGAAVLAVALQASYEPILRDEEPLHFESKGGLYTLQHAADAGKETKYTFTFELPAGRYVVEQLDVDGRCEWRGQALLPDGNRERTMVQAYRFRRVSA